MLKRYHTTKPSLGARVADVDMTSMVDVTFLLLIFFMVTASFSLQKSIATAREPAGATANPVDLASRSIVDVLVNQNGVFWVRCDAWNREFIGKQSLISSLKQIVVDQSRETKVRVSVVDQAKLQLLVDALDGIAAAGLTNVTVQQVTEDDIDQGAADSFASIH